MRWEDLGVAGRRECGMNVDQEAGGVVSSWGRAASRAVIAWQAARASWGQEPAARLVTMTRKSGGAVGDRHRRVGLPGPLGDPGGPGGQALVQGLEGVGVAGA